MGDLLTQIAERFGLVPVYALIVGWGALQASSLRQLVVMLGIMAGVYVVMFKAFNLGGGAAALGARLGLNADAANAIAALVFVYGLGFAVYGLRHIAVRHNED